MKTAKHLLFLASMMFGVGCATEPAPVDPAVDQDEATSQADQEIGGGGFCTAHENCYWLCRVRFKCTDQTSCFQLSDCLDACDADYPGC